MKPYKINVPFEFSGSFNEVQDQLTSLMSEATGQDVYVDLTVEGKLTLVFKDKNEHEDIIRGEVKSFNMSVNPSNLRD